MSDNFVKEFLCFLDAIKTYHWQTKVYARHIASDSLHKNLSKKVDDFVETYYGTDSGERPEMADGETNPLKNYTDENIVQVMKSFRKYVNEKLTDKIDGNNGLLHIRDEMIADIDKTLYLFTFH